MKATELRIGNLICNKEGTIVYVNTTHLTLLLYGIENEFKLIPLTEEWLLKFGFEKSMSWTYVIELKGNLKLVYYLGEKGWSIGFKSYSDFSNLEYVHQLQNLYFALTGEELKPQNIENK